MKNLLNLYLKWKNYYYLLIGGITLFTSFIITISKKKYIEKKIKLAPIKKIIKVIDKKFILFLFIKKKGLKLDLLKNIF